MSAGVRQSDSAGQGDDDDLAERSAQEGHRQDHAGQPDRVDGTAQAQRLDLPRGPGEGPRAAPARRQCESQTK